jgi:histidinol phosphatase-like enzyme
MKYNVMRIEVEPCTLRTQVRQFLICAHAKNNGKAVVRQSHCWMRRPRRTMWAVTCITRLCLMHALA